MTVISHAMFKKNNADAECVILTCHLNGTIIKITVKSVSGNVSCTNSALHDLFEAQF